MTILCRVVNQSKLTSEPILYCTIPIDVGRNRKQDNVAQLICSFLLLHSSVHSAQYNSIQPHRTLLFSDLNKLQHTIARLPRDRASSDAFAYPTVMKRYQRSLCILYAKMRLFTHCSWYKELVWLDRNKLLEEWWFFLLCERMQVLKIGR